MLDCTHILSLEVYYYRRKFCWYKINKGNIDAFANQSLHSSGCSGSVSEHNCKPDQISIIPSKTDIGLSLKHHPFSIYFSIMDLKLVWIVLNYLGSSYLEKFALIFHSRGKFMGMTCKKKLPSLFQFPAPFSSPHMVPMSMLVSLGTNRRFVMGNSVVNQSVRHTF